MFNHIYAFADLITLLYPLENNCYQGYFELISFAEEYADGYWDFWMFADTFAYNFGLMYDALVTSFQSILEENYFMAGYSFGNIIYMVFFVA